MIEITLAEVPLYNAYADAVNNFQMHPIPREDETGMHYFVIPLDTPVATQDVIDLLQPMADDYASIVAPYLAQVAQFITLGFSDAQINFLRPPMPASALFHLVPSDNTVRRQYDALCCGDAGVLADGTASGKYHPDGGDWGGIQDYEILKAILSKTSFGLLIDTAALTEEEVIAKIIALRRRIGPPAIIDLTITYGGA